MLVMQGPPGGEIGQFDLSGNFMGDFVPPRVFASPQYAAQAPDGTFYVSSFTQSRVVRFDSNGNLLEEIVPNDGRIIGNTFLTIRNNELIVSGSNNGAIGVFDLETGEYLRNLVEPGVVQGAHTVFWLDSGEMLVSDIISNSIRRFSSDGTYIDDFSDNPVLAQPAGIELSPDGESVYVANFTDGIVHEFDLATGDLVGELLRAGTNADDLTYGPDGDLYIASYGNNAIYRYDFDTLSAEIHIGTGLRGPNSVLFIPTPGAFVVIGAGLLNVIRRQRT
ncbi:MAG: hypothetical protein Phyf2KO_04630 [Phycisphaerales bacterium]